jgi:hypothetical protein
MFGRFTSREEPTLHVGCVPEPVWTIRIRESDIFAVSSKPNLGITDFYL